MDHREGPPSWLPEGAEPEPGGTSPTSGDSTVSAKAAGDKDTHGNGQDRTGTYSYYGGSYGDGSPDGAFGSERESAFGGTGKTSYSDSGKTLFGDAGSSPFSDPEKTVSVDTEKHEFAGTGRSPLGGRGSAFGDDADSPYRDSGTTSLRDGSFADTSLRDEIAPDRGTEASGRKGARPSLDSTTERYPAGAAQDVARAEAAAPDPPPAGGAAGHGGSSTYSSYSGYGAAGSTGAGTASPYAGAARPKQPAVQPRRANLVVARLEPWSVMKFSFLISLVAWIVLFVAVAILYYALSGLGVFDAIQRTLTSVTSSQGAAGVSLSKWTSASRVLGYTMLIGAVNVVLITALSTVGAMIYNLVTHLGGGIEVTLKETD